jgi:hypothetical protein
VAKVPAKEVLGKFAVALILALAMTTHARATDLQQLTRETQRMSQASQQLTLVWWMPQVWWEASLSSNTILTPEGRAQMLAVLDDYTIFAIARAKLTMATLDARSKAEMLSNARLEIGGKTIDPIAPENLTPSAQSILVALKPVFAGILGKLGQSVEIVIYPGKQGDQKLLDPTKPGSFKYTLYDQTFSWRLPLVSLLPPKVDRKTGEEFPGNYEFNPYTGEALGTK